MSAQPLTNEDVREMIRDISRLVEKQAVDFDRRMKEQAAEYDRERKEQVAAYEQRMQETELQMKRTDKRIGDLTGRIGRMVEHMIGGRILEKFQALGYEVDYYTRNHFLAQRS